MTTVEPRPQDPPVQEPRFLRSPWPPGHEPRPVSPDREAFQTQVSLGFSGWLGPGQGNLLTAYQGAGKTWILAQCIRNSHDRRYVIYCHSHLQADEWSRLIPGALRWYGRDMWAELPEPKRFQCPKAERIRQVQATGRSAMRLVCERCELAQACPYFEMYHEAEQARVLVAPMACLGRLPKKVLKNRVVVIDECPVNELRERKFISRAETEGFVRLLQEFGASHTCHRHQCDDLADFWRAILAIRGQDQSPPRAIRPSKHFLREFGDWLHDPGAENRLQLRSLLGETIQIIAHEALIDNDGKALSFVEDRQPDPESALILLDASGTLEGYRRLLPQFEVSQPFPNLLVRASAKIVQVISGTYGKRSMDQGSLSRLTGLMSALIRHHGISPEDVGVVTRRDYVGRVREAIPEIPKARFLTYGNVRGLNDLIDVKLLFVLGAYLPSDDQVAEAAAEKFGSRRAEVKTHEVWREITCVEQRTQVKVREYVDQAQQAWFEMVFQKEIEQSPGRARPFDGGKAGQTIYILTNTPTGHLVDEAVTVEELLRRIEGPMVSEFRRQLDQKGCVSLKEAAKVLEYKDASMKGAGFRRQYDEARELLGLHMVRGGRSGSLLFPTWRIKATIRARGDIHRYLAAKGIKEASKRSCRSPLPGVDDHKAHFWVHPDGRSWKCFKSGAKGDLIKLVSRLEDLDAPGAVDLLLKDLEIRPADILAHEDAKAALEPLANAGRSEAETGLLETVRARIRELADAGRDDEAAELALMARDADERALRELLEAHA